MLRTDGHKRTGKDVACFLGCQVQRDYSELNLRETVEEDFPHIINIEQEAFPSPWPAEAFTDFLIPGAFSLLYKDEIIGYVFYHGVADEMVIINIAVKPCYQGRGWGEYLLVESLGIMHAKGVRSFYLDVRVSNYKARKLYEKHGFLAIGTRKNYYSNPEEDAIVMGKLINDL